jgi:hypothetical protein
LNVPKTNNGNVGSVLTRLRDERGLVVEGERRACQVTGQSVLTWKALESPLLPEQRKNFNRKSRADLEKENEELRAEVAELMEELNRHHEGKIE